ncbi:hypothetical protein GALL_153120 [mine drainage metagenome]|uniref:Uncharacterized protein n=1 Tax=mine drainage metagenome TaxID=410659 RepID=A0A1J5SR95_9ZZZZ
MSDDWGASWKGILMWFDSTGVADTSREAFHSIPVPNLQACEQEVLALMADGIPRTRLEIANALGWRDGPTCGRCNSLVAKKKLVEDGERINPGSNRKAAILRLPGTLPGQMRLL